MFFVITGLGNPGQRYQASRHNVGFMSADWMAARHGIFWGPGRHEAFEGMGQIGSHQAMLLKPQTYMNLSGQAVEPVCRRLGVDADRLVVIHDDMDLALGRIQIRRGGGDGGHRGVRSIAEHLDRPDFVRVRLGVGRPDTSRDAADHVLSDMNPDELRLANNMLARTAQAIECWLNDGLTVAMNRFNTRKAPKIRKGAESS